VVLCAYLLQRCASLHDAGFDAARAAVCGVTLGCVASVLLCACVFGSAAIITDDFNYGQPHLHTADKLKLKINYYIIAYSLASRVHLLASTITIRKLPPWLLV